MEYGMGSNAVSWELVVAFNVAAIVLCVVVVWLFRKK